MSLALRRFHLEGIGPPGARFDPLTVDLSVSEADAGERAARTALLFLENGGGKTVLLRLLFSVVLPGRRATLGGGRLDGYVQSGDTGHVVLRWDTPDGRGLVTGTVLEWRNRTRSASNANLLQLWYSFVPGPSLDIDTLPFREGDRRVTRNGFRERLAALAREHPGLDLVIEDGPGAWSDHLLRATPLDPETFRYQRQMNADEGDAESLFSGVRTDEDFVRFVVEAVHDPDELGEFAELVGQYAGQLARREELELEGRFCERAAAALRPLGEAAARLGEAEATLHERRAEIATLRRGLQARERSERQAADVAAETAEQLALEAADVDRQGKRVSDLVSELRRLEAEHRLQGALAAESRAEAEVQATVLRAAAWRVLPTVVHVAELQRRRSALHQAQEAVERHLEPLRLHAEQVAGWYAGALVQAAQVLEGQVADAEASASAYDTAADERQRAAAEALQRAGAALERAHAKRERIAAAEAALEAARTEGLVGRSEEPSTASLRSREAERAAHVALDSCRRARRRLEKELQGLADESLAHRQRMVEIEGGAARARDELHVHQRSADAILDHPRTKALAPDAEDAWMIAELLDERLDESLRSGTSEARRLSDDRGRVQHALDALGAEGLLPPPPDVQAVRDTLVDAGIAATTGWHYLARILDEGQRAEVLARNPAAAGGVVVSDPDRLTDAVRAVEAAGIETDHVVVMGTAAHLAEEGSGVAAPVRRALYDPEWTERTRQSLDAELQQIDTRIVELDQRLAADQPLLDLVRELRRACPPARRDELEAGLRRLEQALAEAGTTLTGLETRTAAVRAEIDQEIAQEPALEQAGDEACERRRTTEALAERWAEAERLRAEVDADDEDARARQADAESSAAAAKARRADAEQARRRATDRAREATGLREAASRLGVTPTDPPPDVGVEALKADATAARAAYEAERDGRDLTPEIRAVEEELDARHGVLAAEQRATVDAAEALAPEAGGLGEEAWRGRLDEAEQAARSAREEHARRTAERAQAEQTLQQRTPPGRARHVVLGADDEPPDADTAARWAADRQAEFLQLTSRVRELQSAAGQQAKLAQRADTNAQVLAAAATLLPADPDEADSGSGAEVVSWDGEPQQAAEVATAARGRLDRAVAAHHEAERAFERAVHEVRSVARDAEMLSIGGIRVALAQEEIESLALRSLALADELDGLRRSVERELADVLRHREGLVVRLATLVDTHLRLLRRLERLSTLPDGLGEWSGRPFLTVQFDGAEPGEVPARLAPVVDAAAGDPRQRQPVALLLAGMRAAVVRPSGDSERSFRVRLLRPNRTMQLLWAGVAELDREFSGGMKLTAAICTYCALAALRANSRSAGRLFGDEPGPLFLDNPLGKASADYLLDLQQALAERLGVQLVHTTGVWDVEALATYERVVRLRNLADLRRNLHRLRVDDLPPLVPASSTGVDAVGITVRRER